MKINSFWKYTLIGGIIGLSIGIVISLLDEKVSNVFGIVAWPVSFVIPDARHCSDISCAFAYIISIIIGYTIMGVIGGIIYYYLTTKNKKFWNKLKEDIKQNKRSYIIHGIAGGVLYYLLGLLTALLGFTVLRYNGFTIVDYVLALFLIPHILIGADENLFLFFVVQFIFGFILVVLLKFTLTKYKK